jgi:hypothetical protein
LLICWTCNAGQSQTDLFRHPSEQDKVVKSDRGIFIRCKLVQVDARNLSIRAHGFGPLLRSPTLPVSPKTVKRDWSMAKAWLHGELKPDYRSPAGPSRTRQRPYIFIRCASRSCVGVEDHFGIVTLLLSRTPSLPLSRFLGMHHNRYWGSQSLTIEPRHQQHRGSNRRNQNWSDGPCSVDPGC